MGNMSYCRFHNTLLDLKECEEVLQNGDELSAKEKAAAEKLIELCKDIVDAGYVPGVAPACPNCGAPMVMERALDAGDDWYCEVPACMELADLDRERRRKA